MTDTKRSHAAGFGEFVALMALMISLVALSIDSMLPALPEIGKALGVTRSNDNQLVISLLFLGMGIGQIIYGPLSDSIGRKPAIYVGLGLFVAGSVLSLSAHSFVMMLIGRTIQGLGAAGPRIVTVALIRDQYEGREMARVMSFVMAVFIIVPVVAPLFGQLILMIADWRAIFGAFLVMSVVAAGWFTLRQKETLPKGNRIPFSISRILMAIREILGNRAALGYTVTAGLVSGAFIGYLNSAQQIFQEQYGLGQFFPVFFSALALSVGAASLTNSRLVMRYDMRRLCLWATTTIGSVSAVFLAFSYVERGTPPLWSLMVYFVISFFSIGILFGNLNALAMAPLGHIAGVGAAVVGSLSTLLSLVLGTVIGQSYNGSVLPLVAGFGVLGFLSAGVMHWAEPRGTA